MTYIDDQEVIVMAKEKSLLLIKKNDLSADYKSINQKFSYNILQNSDNFFKVKNCVDCLLIKARQEGYSDYIITTKIQIDNMQYTEKSITTAQYDFKWEQLNEHLDPFYFKDTIWITVAFPNKAKISQHVDALFYLINTKDTNLFHRLVHPNPEINKRDTSFVIAYIEDINNPEIIGIDNVGTIHGWDLSSNSFDYKYSIQIDDCSNVKIGDIFVHLNQKKFIIVCNIYHSYAIDFATREKEHLIKSTGSLVLIKSYSDLSIITISDQILGVVSFFKYDQDSNTFSLFFQIQPGRLQDTLVSIELLKGNVLWIQYSSSMFFYQMNDCLQNDLLCKQCTMSSYFDATNQFDDNGLYGKGLSSNPYSTSANLALSIIKSQQYQEIIRGVQNINVGIFISPINWLDLYFRIITFDFVSLITLEFKSSQADIPATVSYYGQFILQNYNAIILQNIRIFFDRSLNHDCGISFINIKEYAEINNIQLSSNILNMSCQIIDVNKTYLRILKYTISNEDLDQKHIISTINSDKYIKIIFKIYISNLTIEKCKLGISFSILYQKTNVEATIEKLNLTQNECSGSINIIQSISLFTAGLFIINDVILKQNEFCSKNIFFTIPSINHKNQKFQIENIQVIDNKFISKDNFLFNAVYLDISEPSHEITLNDIKFYNNKLLIVPTGNEIIWSKVSTFIQTYNIAEIKLNNIQHENQNNLQLAKIVFANEVTLNNFNCTNQELELNYEYSTNSYLLLPSPYCVYFKETLSVRIQNILIQNKAAIETSLLTFISTGTPMKIELIDCEFKNLFLLEQYDHANPIYVEGGYFTLLINNCHFQNNNLLISSITEKKSTTGLWVKGTFGKVQIIKSTFTNCTSQAKYNFMFIQTSKLVIKEVKMKQSSFLIENQTDSDEQFVQEGGMMNVQAKFSQSTSSRGSFIFIILFGNSLEIAIYETKFSEGYSEIDGSAIFINTSGKETSFTCESCIFENLYTLSEQTASAISFEKHDDSDQSQININQGSIKNIFGYLNNYFIDVNHSKTTISEISEFIYEEYQSNSQAYQTYSESRIKQQATFLNSAHSNINIEKCQFSQLITGFQTNIPLFINSQNSYIILDDIEVFDCIIHYNLIVVKGGELTINNSKFIKITSIEGNNRILEPLSEKQLSSLIEGSKNCKIIVKQSQFSNIICSTNCYGGVFRILDGSVNLEQVKISYVKIRSNISFQNQGYEEGVIYFQGIVGDNDIKNVQFISCSSNQNGGVLSLYSKTSNEFKLIIEDSNFQNNISLNGRGGAIFIKSEAQFSQNQSIKILNSQFNQNQAQIGGAIYEKNMQLHISDDSKFIGNKGYVFGDNYISHPTKLFLANQEQFLSENNAKIVGNQIEVFGFRSGNTLQTISFQLKNDQNIILQPISDEEQKKQNVYVRFSPNNQNVNNYNLKGNLISQYNKDTQFCSFKDLIIVGTPGTSVLIEFKSDLIYNLNIDTNNYEQKYSFNLRINFRECTHGEQIKEYNDLIECDICKPGLYSFNLKQCQDCPTGATCNGGVNIVTQHGYWRKTNESVQIENCNNLEENCIGGSFGDNICYEGHIGALCEECDIYGIKWGNSYTKSGKYSCTRCDKIKNNIWVVVLMTLWTQVSMTLAIKGGIEILREKAAALTLQKNMQKKYSINGKQPQKYEKNINQIQKRSITPIKSNLKCNIEDEDQIDVFEDKSGIYIKLLTNYIQIIGSIATFNLNIPSGIFELPSQVGTPLKSTLNSLDCALEQLNTDIPIIFMRLIFSMIIPLIYMLLFITGILIHYLITKQKNFPWYIISTAVMFLIIYVQPDIVAQSIALISCRKIGDTLYILSNVSYECYTDEHKMYTGYLMIPFLLLWVFILPITLYLMLKKNKKNLNTIQIKLKYGFLYNEYKNRAFYWEFVKMGVKIALILCLNFYSYNIVTKGVLVFIVIVFYGILANIIQPYKEQDVNQIDKNSTFVCAFTVQLGIFIYKNDFDYFVYLAISIIIVINIWFIIKILKRIIKGLTLKIQQTINPLLIKLSKQIPCFEKCLEKKEQKIYNAAVKERMKRVFQKYIDMSKPEKRKFILKTIESQLAQTHGDIFRTYDQNQESQMSEEIKQDEKKSRADTLDSKLQEHDINDISLKISQHKTKSNLSFQIKSQKMLKLIKNKGINTFDQNEQEFDSRFNLQTPYTVVPTLNNEFQMEDQPLNLITEQEKEEK